MAKPTKAISSTQKHAMIAILFFCISYLSAFNLSQPQQMCRIVGKSLTWRRMTAHGTAHRPQGVRAGLAAECDIESKLIHDHRSGVWILFTRRLRRMR